MRKLRFFSEELHNIRAFSVTAGTHQSFLLVYVQL